MTSKRKNLISTVLGNTPRTVISHLKEERLYIKFFDYFTDVEIEEFIETGKIRKLDLIREFTERELASLIDGKNGDFDKRLILSNALFKVEHGLESNFIFPIFQKAIKKMNNLNNVAGLKKQLLSLIDKEKHGILTHDNHQKIVKDFIIKYLTDEEIYELYFSSK